MAGDGSIVIETQLDTEGLEKGLDSLEGIIEKGLDGARDAFGKAFEEIGGSVGGSSFVQGAENIISSVAEAIGDGAAELGSAVRASVSGAAEEISSVAGEFDAGGQELMTAAAHGMSQGGGALTAAAAAAAKDAAGGVNSGRPDFQSGGLSLINSVRDGFSAGSAALGAAAQSITSQTAARMRVNGEFSAVGQNLMAALRSGIAAGASALYAKAAEIAGRVVATIKGSFKIHSPSAVFRDEVGKMLMLGLRDGILNNSEAVLAATEALAEDMLESERRYIEEKTRIDLEYDEADEARRVREYEEKLSQAETLEEREELIEEERLRLKKRADKLYLEQLKTAAETERDIVDALKDDITAAYREIADYAEESLEPVIKSREKLEKKLKDYAADNNSGVSRIRVLNAEGGLEGELYGLADQQESVEMLTRYAAALEAVADRIKSEFDTETARKFMSVLADMDVEEGALFGETLSAADTEDFRRYIEEWGLKNTLAEEISRQIYGEEFTEAVDKATDYMRSELEKLGLEVPEGFFASGSLSAQEFGRGFSQGIDKVLEDTRKMMESFGVYGGRTVGAGASPVVNNNNYYSTYSVNGTRSTAAESIFAIEAAAAMNRYRGLN